MPSENVTISCTRCNGSGSYHGGPSRWGHQCFGCNGTGRMNIAPQSGTFNVMPNQETAPSRMNRAERNWLDFATRYPSEAAWLQSPASGDFGVSLIKGCRRYGGLTPRQLAAVQRNATVVAAAPATMDATDAACHARAVDILARAQALNERAGSTGAYHVTGQTLSPIVGATPDGVPVTEQDVRNGAQVTLSSMVDVMRNETARNGVSPRVATPAPATITIDATNVRRAMDAAAASGLRKVRLVLGAVTFKLSGSRFVRGAGHILCYHNGQYAGSIDRQDAFHPRSGLTRTVPEDTLEAFRAAASDPQAAARTYGHDTGHCSCCRRLLTDPPSVMAGIGPICSQRFGWS